MNDPRRHYLDHASTSPVRPAAVAAMVEALGSPPADPARLHQEGTTARHALEVAREQVAALVGARPREVVFTSGGTEAVATAVHGAAHRAGPAAHFVGPAVEHSCVTLSSARHRATWVDVDGRGRVDPDVLLAAVTPDTALVHLQWGNHEVGTIQPVAEVVTRCREQGVLVHVDAAQAVGQVPVAFDDLGCDLMTVSGHKFGAPPGTGALLIRLGLRLEPLLVGGDQERARRAGLENVPALLGFGVAADDVASGLATEEAAARAHTDRIVSAAERWPGVTVFGDPEHRLPHIVCLGLDGVEPQAVLLGLDRAGVAAHSGSACASETIEPSPVLAAMGVPADRSLRISVGWSTADADVDALLDAVPAILDDLRSLAG